MYRKTLVNFGIWKVVNKQQKFRNFQEKNGKFLNFKSKKNK